MPPDGQTFSYLKQKTLSIMFERATIFTVIFLAVVAFLLDLPWLYLSSQWSGEMIRDIQGSALVLNPIPAIIVYLAIGFLATIPTTPTESFGLGAATYAVYDFTNLATLKKYQPLFALVDTFWGGVLFTLVFYVRSFVST
jgi:uncharacterized membrane protein